MGPVPKRALRQMGSEPKQAPGPKGPWAQTGAGPKWVQLGPGPKQALGPNGPGQGQAEPGKACTLFCPAVYYVMAVVVVVLSLCSRNSFPCLPRDELENSATPTPNDKYFFFSKVVSAGTATARATIGIIGIMGLQYNGLRDAQGTTTGPSLPTPWAWAHAKIWRENVLLREQVDV